MPRTGHRGQRSEAAQNRRVERGAGLRKAGANLTPVERDAVNRLIARDLARIDGDGDADGTPHRVGGGHRQDESREQRVESAHQHSAGRHVRRFEHGRHEAAVETLRVRRQGGGLDQVLTEGESVPWRHRSQVQRVAEDRGGSRSESRPRRSRSGRRPARRAALLRPHNASEGSGHGQGRTRGCELRTPTLAKAHSGVRAEVEE